MICMKTAGQIVREWRESQGLSTREVAQRVTNALAGGGQVKRQNLEQFEADQVAQPRYLHALASVMGYDRLEDLLAGKPPAGTQQPADREQEQMPRDWPFKGVSPSMLDGLSNAERGFIEGAIQDALEQLRALRRGGEQAGPAARTGNARSG